MVLEAIAALSLASSVIQFVDFASKLISKGNKFYGSADGTLDEHVELGAIGDNLKRLSKGLLGSLEPFSDAEQLTPEEIALQNIAEKCQDIAISFKAALDGLRIVGTRTRWKSFRQAVKCHWSKEKIEEMLQMLRLVREDLVVHLLVVINNQQATNKHLMTNLNKQMEREILASIRDSSTSIRHEITTLSAGLRQVPEPKRPFLVDVWRAENTEQLSQLGLNMSKVAKHEEDRKITNLMLHSLYFPQMKDRYRSVAKAHVKTFSWIFDSALASTSSWSNYVQWLVSRDSQANLYWVTGKAGSGKSTLMKYLCDYSPTREHLGLWAAPDELVFASCFFWNPGSEDQKSLIGLLRSLLHDILSQRTDLIEVASAWRWQAYELGASALSPWTSLELLDALKNIVIEPKHGVKFAFYVDGLDEFEGDDGARSDIIDLLKEIASCEHNKVCMSSRPWLIFEDAFESGPSLRLEDLTYNDITEYAKIELGGTAKFQKLRKSNAIACTDLIRKIVDKAAGVFLWVFLVVRLLSQGLQNEDDVIDLHRRLDLMPADLEEFFARMIGTLDPFYLRQAARLFQIALEAQTPTLLTYSFTQERDPDFAFNAKVRPLSEEEGVERLTSMRRLLNSRCKGLLEVHEEPVGRNFFVIPTVHFLHRTARDFLQLSAKLTKLGPYLSEHYDVRTEICKSSLAQVKSMDLSVHFVSVLLRLLEGIMVRIRSGKHDAQANTRILDELHKTIKISTFYEAGSMSSDWTVVHRSTQSLSQSSARNWTDSDSFFSLAITAGLHNYVKYRINCDSSLVKCRPGRPLLDSALRPHWSESTGLSRSFRYGKPIPDPSLVKVILDKGGDLNEAYGGSTVWNLFLGGLMIMKLKRYGPDYSTQQSDLDCWEEVTRLCLIAPTFKENSLYVTLADSELNGGEILERFSGKDKAQSLIMTSREARRALNKQALNKPEDSKRRRTLAMKIAHFSSKCTKPFQAKKL